MITFDIRSLVDQKFNSIAKFSDAMEITYAAAHKLYYGEISRINLETLDKLCIVLDCTPDTIFGFDTKTINIMFLKNLSGELEDNNKQIINEINRYLKTLEKR